jgi:hypothetical protein
VVLRDQPGRPARSRDHGYGQFNALSGCQRLAHRVTLDDGQTDSVAITLRQPRL